jgi:molybdopterin synthase sulfur carrier subunit
MAGMKVQVRYFASIREVLGPTETVELPDGSTLAALRDELISRSHAHAQALGRGRALRAALNQVMADESVVVVQGVEVAFFPPVTGG